MHMRCYAHILNLIVQSGLKSIHESIAKVRNAVQYVRASPARFEKLQEYVDKEIIKAKCLLSLDVSTRWNSIYLKLDYALKFVRVFDRLEEEDEHYKLYFCEADGNGKKLIGPSRYLDLENVKTFVKFLGIFYKVTLRFSGSLFVTSNIYFHELIGIENQLQQLCSVDGDPLLRSMAGEMKKNMISIGEI